MAGDGPLRVSWSWFYKWRGQVLKRLQRSREVLPQLVAQPLHVQCRSYVSVLA